ncbi:hypothetical protein VP01_2740g1 [Puccinia sorghi]|uniref:Uncharacterized protein n=1 Tax=Puccinia sorghi TaxID=27349 RepID=A0A0L6V338_9BASI|nr:hypothetical protein VP01_2740g1 [Puccinia sorghi]
MAEHIYLCQQWIASQSSAFKSKYLPVGYEEGNVEAISSVVGFLCNLVKHEQTLLCNLSSFSPTSNRNQVVSESGLCQKLYLKQSNNSGPAISRSEWHYYKWSLPTTTSTALQETPACSGMSSMITLRYSEHGDWFRSKHNFAILLTRRDQQLFNGREMIEDINRQDIRLPTEDEVEELRVSMATQGAGAVNQLLDDETAAS